MKKYRLFFLAILVFLLNTILLNALVFPNIRVDYYKKILDKLNKFDSAPDTLVEQREQFAKYLEEIGIVIDSEGGNYNLDGFLRREEAVVLVCRTLNIDLEGFAPRFTQYRDVDMREYYYPYVSYMTQKGMFGGVSEDLFGIGTQINAYEYLSLILKMLDYEVIENVTDTMEKAKEVGLLYHVDFSSQDDAITRGEAFTILYNSLFANPSGQNEPFYRKADLTMPISMQQLEVKGVSVNNLREIHLELNVPISPVFKESKFTVKNANIGKFSPRVSNDGNTLILFTGMNMKKDFGYELEIENLFAQNGTKMEKAVVTFHAKDMKVPEIISVNQLDSTSIEVLFDEPISNPGIIEIGEGLDSSKSTFSRVDFKNIKSVENGNAFHLIDLDLKPGQEYTIRFKNYIDYVGNVGIRVEKRILFNAF